MCCTLYIVLENKVGYTNPWVHQEAKQHHRVHKKEDHRHQGTQIGHQTDDSPCAHKGHLTGLPWLLDEDVCKIWIPFPFVVRWKSPEIEKLCSVYKCMDSSRARNEWKTIQKIFTVERYWVLPWFGASLGLGSMMASRPLLLLWLSHTQSVCSCCTGLCVWICPNWKTYLFKLRMNLLTSAIYITLLSAGLNWRFIEFMVFIL